MVHTERWLARARNELEHAYNRYELGHNEYEVSEIERTQLVAELAHSQFTVDGVTRFLKRCRSKQVYSIQNISLTLMCTSAAKKANNRLTIQIVKSLYRTAAIARMFGTGGASPREINVVLLPMNKPRRKPIGEQQVEPKHVNGGYTYVNNGSIYIYRLEEWPKVMLHEVLHNFPRLQDVSWTPAMLRQLYTTFGIDTTDCSRRCKTDLEPTEAIIEAWAIFLNIAFLSFETEGNFYKMLKNEIQWNDHHIQWILKKKQAEPDGKWKEGTHLFSYLVLRGIILHNLEQFLGLSMPYDPAKLLALWKNGWVQIKLSDRAGPADGPGRNSLRMSRYGDL